MKNWIIATVLLGVGMGGFAAWRSQVPGPEVPVPVRSTTAIVSPRNITFSVAAAGDIGPDGMVSVRPEINGRIASLPVDIGDQVKKGDLLCALDDRDLQTERSGQLTEIEGAKLQVARAKRNYERNRQLHQNNLVSQELFDDSLTEFELAQNALQRAERALSQIEDRLFKTRIIAPFDCTVLTRPVSIGQAISGSGGVGGGTEIMSIANLQEMIITAHLNQADVIQLQSGQEVTVSVEAVPGLTMIGVVERIAPQATVRNNIKGFTTQVRLSDLDSRVRPGMTANMAIPVASAQNVLAVPISAVFTEEGERFVYVQVSPSGFEMRPVQIGMSDYQFAEIRSGLSDGEVVSLVRPSVTNLRKSATEVRLSQRSASTNQSSRTVR